MSEWTAAPSRGFASSHTATDEHHTAMCPEERRRWRADALQFALSLHGEFSGQEVFRSEELTSVLSYAERIYCWITGETS